MTLSTTQTIKLLITLALLSLGNNIAHASVEDGVYSPPQYKDLRTNPHMSSLTCLAVNAYHEARSESKLAVISVMAVVLNRVKDVRRFPNGICDVVFKSKAFSWVGDKHSDEIENHQQYKRMYRLATYVIENRDVVLNLVGDIDHYHHVSIRPWWSGDKGFKKVSRVDNHIFYSSVW